MYLIYGIFSIFEQVLGSLRLMKSINLSKSGYASIACATILNIPYNLILQQNLMIPRFLLQLFQGAI
jgi:hypothetical protein